MDVEKPDVKPAGAVLANAFRNYPFFEYCLGDADNYDRMAPGMFEGFVRWTMLYGKAWTTSDMNAVALRQPPGEQRHRILECLAFRFSVFLFADGRCHEAPIWSHSSDRHRDSQKHHGGSATLALLDDGRATSSSGHGGRRTTDAVHV
jgi:hypothetical protein